MTDGIYGIGAMGYHFGNACRLADMIPAAPADVLVMGNVDPAGQINQGTPESVREATVKVMEECCHAPNFVISTGCDIPPMSPWANIEAFFAAAEEFYR
jgi:uroporphyrinogen decarboxylase